MKKLVIVSLFLFLASACSNVEGSGFDESTKSNNFSFDCDNEHIESSVFSQGNDLYFVATSKEENGEYFVTKSPMKFESWAGNGTHIFSSSWESGSHATIVRKKSGSDDQEHDIDKIHVVVSGGKTRKISLFEIGESNPFWPIDCY